MESLLVERADGVVTCTLNRPAKKNAVTNEMWIGLAELFDEVAENRADRVLVITGAGDGFCSGADLGATTTPDGGRGPAAAMAGMRIVGRAALRLHELAKPTIAAVNGVAAGAGCNLALGCDLIVASGTRPLQRDLLEARARGRLRRFVVAAATRRHAPGQGARAPRRHHRRAGSGADRPRQPGGRARSPARRGRASWRAASRTCRRLRSRCRSGSSTRLRRSRWRRPWNRRTRPRRWSRRRATRPKPSSPSSKAESPPTPASNAAAGATSDAFRDGGQLVGSGLRGACEARMASRSGS